MEYIRRNKSTCWLFILFALIIFAKILVFQHITAGGLLFRSLWRAPVHFWYWLLPKVAISVCIASFVFIAKRQYWTVIVGFLIDIWCIANLIYFRAYNDYFDIYTMSLGGNMKGFWSSVLFFMSWKDILFPLLTIAYLPLVIKTNNTKRNWRYSLVGLFLSIIFSYISTIIILLNQELDEFDYPKEIFSYNPFSAQARKCYDIGRVSVIQATSILHDIGYILNDFVILQNQETPIINYGEIENLIKSPKNLIFQKRPCIIIIVESLEDWAINDISMPHLTTYMETHPHLHAHKIKKQTLSGNSADGQLIINTGLLPIASGATCYMFPNNTYPSIADCSVKKAATILPHSIESWNQQYMSPAYHYDTTIVRDANDSLLFSTTIDLINNGYDCVQVITLSSHVPFDYGASRSNLVLPKDMPYYMSQYLKCINYFDSGLNILLEALETDTLLKEASVIITGDHTIFYDKARETYSQYVEQNNMFFRVKDAFCPLIILSPNIDTTTELDDVCYQMDIYPTIMHILGCKNYYWKGFGVNLMDSTAIHHRSITEKEAYDLSDRLIRSNWFSYMQ